MTFVFFSKNGFQHSYSIESLLNIYDTENFQGENGWKVNEENMDRWKIKSSVYTKKKRNEIRNFVVKYIKSHTLNRHLTGE